MHKSKQNINTTLNHFSIYPDDIKNNSIISRIHTLMKGYIGIQVKIRYPVVVIGEDGVAQKRFDYDSLYVEDPNK
jgi:Tat protein secretion system quality control protein TatD with DNase activity